MKANELRLGNYIYERRCDGKLYVGQVTHIQTCDSLDKIKSNGWFVDSPIPLTEEWLLKFGFEKIIYDSEETGYGTEYHLKVNDELFISYADDFSCELYDSKIRMPNGIGIIPSWEKTKYVHGLQNIVFALTGEELTLKS